MLRSFRDDRSGATAVEYGLIVGVLGVALLLSAGKARDVIDGVVWKLTSAGDAIVVKLCDAGETCSGKRTGGDGDGAASRQAPVVR